MKQIYLLFLFLLSVACSFAQGPVNFSYSQERINANEVILTIKARLTNGGQLYSVNKTSEEVPYSAINFDSSLHSSLKDSVIEKGRIISEPDPEFGNAPLSFSRDSIVWQQKFSIPATETKKIKGQITYMVKQNESFNAFEEAFSVNVKPEAAKAEAKPASEEKNGKSLAGIMLIAFIAGIGTVLTPCVFPLIPVTVGFFTKRSGSREQGIRNALLYSLSIILIYTIPTFILTGIFGDSVLYKISSSTTANLLFFAIFIVFAISFFGAFEINLPSSWANAIDSKAGKGGLLGIFFMALTLVVVSFSCTGPIMSSLITGTASQGVKFGTAGGMLAFSLGLALPFSLFAFFPSFINSLPRSGGWLNSVKVVFGFLELALALKFLSNADLANYWGILDREVFLVLWIVLFALMGMYLIGKLRFSHDSDLPYISVPRLFLAISSFSFALYMVPGLWGAPLKMLSGLLPHPSTQDFDLHELRYEIEQLKHKNSTSYSEGTALPPKKWVELFHMPFGLQAYYDRDEALQASKAFGKPIMIDFTGHSCANCRKMENEVWSKPEVLERLRNDFVILSLYVDDKTELPEEEQYVSKRDGSTIKTIGEKNLDYEQEKFNEVAQPLYMFLDSNGELLSNEKYGYDSDVEKFLKHLEGVKAEYVRRAGPM